MRVEVCTLFEKQYHLGVAVLVNSLARAGFGGTVHVGFRGPLPPWAKGAVPKDDTTWELPLPKGPCIRFKQVETGAHFTNYKPEFMQEIFSRSDADAVLYFDPDVVVNTSWRYLEEWLTCGIAVCDDVNSPMAENHPTRVGWRRFFKDIGMNLRYRGSRYANGGVVGVAREHRHFLEMWIRMMGPVAALLGGSDVAGIAGGRTLGHSYGFADCFRKTDQDVLNAAFEACPDIPVSFLGKQAMGFDAGRPLLPHATGNRKPWTRHFVREALAGRPPARVDKFFWMFADGPLRPFSSARVFANRWRVTLAAAVGRLIRRT
jgi:hypothetical protein